VQARVWKEAAIAFGLVFHLMDVSRPRPPAKLDEPALESDQPRLEPLVPPLAEATPSPAATEPLPPTLLAASIHSIVADDSPAPASSFVVELPPATTEPGSEVSASQSVPSEPDAPAEREKPAAPQLTVTTRSQAHLRRKPKTAASEDWFAAHGKFIAAAFVVALIGTIYFARTSRQQTPAVSDTAKDTTVAKDSLSRTLIASGESSVPQTAPLINTVSATTESKAELHAPTTPASGLSADDNAALNFPAGVGRLHGSSATAPWNSPPGEIFAVEKRLP